MGQLSSKESERQLRPNHPVEGTSNVLETTASSTTSAPSVMQVGDVGAWQDQLLRQTRIIQRVANITYEEFLTNVRQINDISSYYLDENGKQLVFAVKKGSDSTIFWKATVRIVCVKVDTSTKEIESHKSLSLKQFLQIFYHLKHQADAVVNTDDTDCHRISQAATDKFIEEHSSDLGDKGASNTDECVICLERKPDLILPCAHSYCMPCITQWNLDHKTCPICRETVSSTEDGWVISDGPDCTEITTEIQKSLLRLTQ